MKHHKIIQNRYILNKYSQNLLSLPSQPLRGAQNSTSSAQSSFPHSPSLQNRNLKIQGPRWDLGISWYVGFILYPLFVHKVDQHVFSPNGFFPKRRNGSSTPPRRRWTWVSAACPATGFGSDLRCKSVNVECILRAIFYVRIRINIYSLEHYSRLRTVNSHQA